MTNVRFKISKVEVNDEEGKVKQTIEALSDDDKVITTFTLECGLQEASNLRRIKEQSIKMLFEYQQSVDTMKVIQERKTQALALEGRIIGEKTGNQEV